MAVASWNPIGAGGESDTFDYIDLSAVDQDLKEITGARSIPFSEAPSRARQLVRSGDILVSTVRPNLNGVAMVPPELDGATASTGFCVLRADPEKLEPRYLFHWVKTSTFIANMVRLATGASYPAVSDKIVLASRIPLPPLPEQRRIAAILDKADALCAKRREALAQLDRLAQSIFVEMFGDPASNPKNWKKRKLRELTNKIGSGATPTGGDSAYKEAGISLIRSMNVHDGRFVRKSLAYIDNEQAAKLRNVVVEEDDVLLNITGASVARVCRAPSDVLPARVNQHVMILRPTTGLSSVFLERLLLNPSMKANLLRVGGSGATREAITKTDVEELQIIVPDEFLQTEFELRMRRTFSLQAKNESDLVFLERLFSSVQHRAFQGEI